MLIVLSEELRTRDLAGPLSAAVRDSLLNLSTAVYEGKHLITGSRALFATLRDLEELGPIVCGRFRQAQALLADAEEFRRLVGAYITVHPVESVPWVEAPSAPGRDAPLIFHLPLDHFDDSGHAARAQVLGEDQRDANIYEAMGRAYGTRHPGFSCELQPAPGNGSNTYMVLDSLAEHHTVLCIVDSDKSSETGPVGPTATKVLTCLQNLRGRGKVAAVHVLPCRELENLLPAALVLDALPSDPNDQERKKVIAGQICLGLVDFVRVKQATSTHLLDWVCAHVGKISSQTLAQLCFASVPHDAVDQVGRLLWSFGLAPRRGRL